MPTLGAPDKAIDLVFEVDSGRAQKARRKRARCVSGDLARALRQLTKGRDRPVAPWSAVKFGSLQLTLNIQCIDWT
jgi:hypothetical protein